MARMPSKRWVEMVEPYDSAVGISSDVVVTLLARQHRAFEQMVRDLMPRTTVGSHNYARKEVLKELLAALATRKGGG